jgi:hypothetical protein
MAYFADADEVYQYIGGAFRLAADHPTVGPKLRAANVTLRLDYSNPNATLTIRLTSAGIDVIEGETDVKPDISISMSADNANKFWRGQYNATIGMAKGEAKTRGPIGKVLKLLPAAKPVFPLYKELVAQKDAS